jgi:hypothetical protein
MTATWKTATFWIHLLGWVAALGATVANATWGEDPATSLLAPQWCSLITAGVGCLYVAVRWLQRIVEGTPAKTLFRSTDTWATALTMLSQIALALGGVLPASYAITAVMASALLLKVSRMLSPTVPPTVPPVAEVK